jgi:hypothetical protein
MSDTIVLERALARRAAIISTIAKIDRYLGSHDEVFGTNYLHSVQPVHVVTLKKYRKGQQKRVVERTIEILKARGEPMARIEIAEQLVKEGLLVISGAPHRYIGTTFNRNRDIFQRVSKGLWTLCDGNGER